MPQIECLLWDKNVPLGGSGVGLIPLPQDDYSIPRMLVGKVHPEDWARMVGKYTLYYTGHSYITILYPSPSVPPWMERGNEVALDIPTECCY